MGEIFRELQEESKERETRAAFERWMAERGTPLPLEQTQAYEAFKAGMGHQHCMTVVQIFRTDGAALAQPEAHPPRDEWRPASEPPEDGRDVVVWCAQERRAVHGMYIRRRPPIAGLVDGWVAPDASELTHWRDVTPPTESPIAAKCQRIEGSGEICGLTPPCPDCGPSLIDVAEDA